jgi:hypothetical protein
VKDHETRLFESRGVLGGVAGRRGYELDVVRHDKVHDVGVAHEGLGDVDAEGLVGELTHQFNFALDVIEFTRGGLNDAEATGVGDGTGESAARDPTHGCLQDWFFDSQEFGNAIVDSHGCPFRLLANRTLSANERRELP